MHPKSMLAPLLVLLGASCRGYEGGVTVYNSPPAVTITHPVSGTDFDEGAPIEFRALVNDDEGADALQLTWLSAIDGVLFEDSLADSAGNVVYITANLSPGNHVISLRAIDADAMSAEGEVTVKVNDLPDAPAIVIQHPVGSERGEEGKAFKFAVVVSDAQDDPRDLLVTLDSSLDGRVCSLPADASGYGSCTEELTPGDHLLTFMVIDADAFQAQATTYFTVLSHLEVDNDGDGFTELQGDCDDTDSHTYPGAPETYNGRDDDCDGIIDEGTVGYDDDGDGFTELQGDCDDADPRTYPGAPEIEDGKDNDCDFTVDEGTNAYDDDGDGFSENDGDCNDADATVYPGAAEVCHDGRDNDCDGFQNEEGASGCTAYYLDNDSDGYGAPGSTRCLCPGGEGAWKATNGMDCYDGNNHAYPGSTGYHSTHRGDGSFDYNCDGVQEQRWKTKAGCAWEPFNCVAQPEGWKDGVVGCGLTAAWTDDCSACWSGCCVDNTGAKTQECR